VDEPIYLSTRTTYLYFLIILVLTLTLTMTRANINIDDDDEGLNEDELKKIEDGYKEVILIKKGLSKTIPAYELWDE